MKLNSGQVLVAALITNACVCASEPVGQRAKGDGPAPPLNGTARLVLTNGVGQSWRGDLRLELTCKNGVWQKDVYGRGLSRLVHSGHIRDIKSSAAQSVLDVRMVIAGDAWIRGFTADYRLTLRVHERKVTGTYTYRADDQAYEGKLTGRIEDLPEVAKDFVPPQPGEHPRLLIRRSEIPRLKQLAQSPWGKKLIARMKKIRPDDHSIADVPGDPYLPKGISAYGLANGLLFNLTGELKYADNCRQFIEATWNDNSGNNMESANRRLTIALTYDLAYHGLPPDFRTIVAGWIGNATAYNLRRAPKVTNIHPDVYLGGAAQDKTSAPPAAKPEPEQKEPVEAPAPAPADRPPWAMKPPVVRKRIPRFRATVAVTERELQRIDQWMQGDPCFGRREGRGSWPVCVLHIAAHAYLNMTGKRLLCASNLLPSYVAVGRSIGWEDFATGFRQVPDSQRPAVLWAWKKLPDTNRNPVFTFINFPRELEAKNPADALPNPYFNPTTGFCQFRRSWGEKDDIAVNAYFKCFPANYTTRPNAGTFAISGLGHTWVPRGTAAFHLVHLALGGTVGSIESRLLAENVVQFAMDPINGEAGGRDIKVRGTGNGSGVLSAVMDDTVAGGMKPIPHKSGTIVPGLEFDPDGNLMRKSLRDLGIRWRRSIGVDFADGSGALAVIAVVDQTKGGKKSVWQMRIGENPKVEIKGSTFIVRHNDGTSLSGTVISPPDAKLVYVNDQKYTLAFVRADGGPSETATPLRAIHISGGRDYFVVMTLQRGEPPKVLSKGAGLDARATIGPAAKARMVSFDGESVVWSNRAD